MLKASKTSPAVLTYFEETGQDWLIVKHPEDSPPNPTHPHLLVTLRHKSKPNRIYLQPDMKRANGFMETYQPEED
jgi:hypothetical protein